MCSGGIHIRILVVASSSDFDLPFGYNQDSLIYFILQGFVSVRTCYFQSIINIYFEKYEHIAQLSQRY